MSDVPSAPTTSGQDAGSRMAADLPRKQPPCQLINQIAKDSDKIARPAALKSTRFLVVALALLSPFVVTYSRTIINFALTDMIEPDQVPPTSTSNSEEKTPLPVTQANLTQTNIQQPQLAFFDLDNSCPVEDPEHRKWLLKLNDHDIERAQNSPGEKFKWDTFEQGILMSAYQIGHTPLQIPGGRLSELYGSRRVISASLLSSAILCYLAPAAASLNIYLLFVDLLMLGVLGSFVTPALMNLFANWLTPGERSICVSFYMVASRLGYSLSALLCGLLIQAELSWRVVFYSAALISLSFSILFLVFVRGRPSDHPWTSSQELAYLATKNTLVRESLLEREPKVDQCSLEIISGPSKKPNNIHLQQVIVSDGLPEAEKKPEPKSPDSAPWLAIATSTPVWAYVITKFCVKFAGDTVQMQLPTYLKRVMHYSAAANGMVNGFNYVIFCVGCLVVGTLSKMAVKRRPLNFSKTAVRKLFQSIASFGVAGCLIGIAFSICNEHLTHLFLILFFFVTTFGIGGEAQMPLDLTERYSGTLHAIGSSLAISGALVPTIVGEFLRGHAADKDRWRFIWFGASAVAASGGITFLIFGDANIQPFDSIGRQDYQPQVTTNNNKTGNVNPGFQNDAGRVEPQHQNNNNNNNNNDSNN